LTARVPTINGKEFGKGESNAAASRCELGKWGEKAYSEEATEKAAEREEGEVRISAQ